MSETITNCNSLKSFQKSLIFSLFFFDFISNSWSVFACIALSENKQRHISSDTDHRKTSSRILVQFAKSSVEVISNIIHIFAVRIWMVWISITQTSTYRLIYKNNIVVLDPSIVIFYYLVGSHGNWPYEMWPQLHEISKLTG